MSLDERAVQRVDGRNVRRSVSQRDRCRAQRRLVTHLSSMQLARFPTIGVTVADDGEPDLSAFAETLRSRGHRLALPVPDRHDATMRFVVWESDDALGDGSYGIPCPPSDRPTVIPGAVIVPLVRFDSQCNRIGRGKGYYDRWLAAHDCFAVGAAFEVQRAVAIDPAPHDVPLDAVVTDLGIRWCRSRWGAGKDGVS